MKLKVVTTATDRDHPGFKVFEKSLKKFGWDYHIIDGPYYAYGSKAINAYEFACKTDATHLLVVDANDVIFTGNQKRFLLQLISQYPHWEDSIIFNAEKACWPYKEWESRYPSVTSEWKYLNGGVLFANVERFKKLFDDYVIHHHDNDQVFYADIFLRNAKKYHMYLDHKCELFQSVAFCEPDEFLQPHMGHYDSGNEETGVVKTEVKMLFNRKNLSFPVIIHGNGGTDLSPYLSLID